MSDFSTPICSRPIYLPMDNINTDMIIPAQFLKITDQKGLGEYVFINLRKKNPQFPIFDGRSILLAGHNFGCGSSREHAVWALKQAGIKVIISAMFADIFSGNAEKNNILTIVMPPDIIATLANNNAKISVDLNTQVVTSAGKNYPFTTKPFIRTKLLQDISDFDYLYQRLPDIKKFAQHKHIT